MYTCARVWAWRPASKTTEKEANVIGSTGNKQRFGQTGEVTWTSGTFQGCAATKSKTSAGTFQGVAPCMLTKKKQKGQYKTSNLLTTAVKPFHRRNIYKTPKVGVSPGKQGHLTSVSSGRARLAVMEGTAFEVSLPLLPVDGQICLSNQQEGLTG